jgi:MoaA/NifB/PqqE/SkfB family radical SAM enzyme
MDVAPADRLGYLALEITGRCQLACTHCYADSGPHRTHGVLDTGDWLRLLDQAAGMGVRGVQLIGGEPTLRPDLPVLVEHALALGMQVEVYSNLAHMTSALWALCSRPGVSLGTSYYSRVAEEHDAVTGRRSHRRTLANIEEAVRRSIPLRIGVIRVHDDQDVDGAVDQLAALGIDRVGIDDARQLGRGARDQEHDAGQLCGHCNDGRVAVLPTGDVVPCPLARWVVLGSVVDHGLEDIYGRSGDARRGLVDAWARAHREQPPARPFECSPLFACGRGSRILRGHQVAPIAQVRSSTSRSVSRRRPTL